MPKSETPTEEVANSAKKIIKHTIGTALKIILIPIIVISIILIMLVSFLKVIWKADTADQMMKGGFVENATEDVEKELG